MPTFPESDAVKAMIDEARRDGRILSETGVRPPDAPAVAKKPRKKRGRPEYEFQKAVIELAQLRGWLVAHFRSVPVRDKAGNVYHQTPVDADGAGFPDLILLRGVSMVVAELKAGANKPSPEQERWLAAFRKLYIVQTFVWYPSDWPEIERILA